MARAFSKNTPFTKRFSGREAEVVDQIKIFGYREFCRQEFGDENRGNGLQGWFQKQAGCEHDSIYHYVGISDSLSDLHVSSRVYLSIQNRDAKWQRLVERLKTRIAELERDNERKDETIRQYQSLDYRMWQPVIELAESKIEEAEI